jgi:hypothetical protein
MGIKTTNKDLKKKPVKKTIKRKMKIVWLEKWLNLF